MNIAQHFDRWVNSGDFTLATLARFRVLLAAFLLLQLPNFHWVASYPSLWFTPPPGPFELFDAFPPSWFLRGIEALLAVSLVALLAGWHTRAASVSATTFMLIGYGFTYSLGKIDHTILMVLAPLILSFSGWGGAWSLDAQRGSRRGENPAVEQWPVRLLALLLGVAFMTAAIPKLLGGWLNPSTHTVQATLFEQFYGHGRTRFLAENFIQFHQSFFWESLDYLTIALEGGLLFAVASWRSLRVACAVACIFHLSVYLMMNIAFTPNVVIYAAFVQWDRILRLPSDVRLSKRVQPTLLVVPAILAFLLFASASPVHAFQRTVAPGVLFAGAGIGAIYLVVLLRGLFRKRDLPEAIDLRSKKPLLTR